MRTLILAIVAAFFCLTGCTLPYQGQDHPVIRQDPLGPDNVLVKEIPDVGPFPQVAAPQVDASTTVKTMLGIVGGGLDSSGNVLRGAWYDYLQEFHDGRIGNGSPAPLHVSELYSLNEDPGSVCQDGTKWTVNLVYPATCPEKQSGFGHSALALLPAGFSDKMQQQAANLGSAGPLFKSLVASLLYLQYLHYEMQVQDEINWPEDNNRGGLFGYCVAGITLRALMPAGIGDDQFNLVVPLMDKFFAPPNDIERANRTQRIIDGYTNGMFTNCKP